MLKCSKCGNECKESEKFCSNCGHEINNGQVNTKKIPTWLLVVIVIAVIFIILQILTSSLDNHYDKKRKEIENNYKYSSSLFEK